MAETVIKLQDRGQCVLTSIDLFDEGQLGAGQTIFRARYETLGEIKQAISDVLQNSPIDEDGQAKSPLSVNRFNSNNVHGLREYDIHDLYPNKSRWLVHFLLRFNFGQTDFCYIDLGLNWQPLKYFNGEYNPNYPLGDYTFGQVIKLEDLKILRVCMCTIDDAIELIKEFNLSDPKALEVIDPTAPISPEQIENIKSDDPLLVTLINGEDTILTINGEIATIKQDN